MSEILVPNVIQKRVLEANTNEVEASKKEGYTILGDIALAIENNNEMVEKCNEVFARYISANINYKRMKRYEENSNFIEKYIRNNSSRIYLYKEKGEFINFLLANGIPVVEKLFVKTLDYFDTRKMKESLWVMCKKYAYMITHNNWKKYPSVYSYLMYVSILLFRKKKAIDEEIGEDWAQDLVLPKQGNTESIAYALYMIYSQKHLYQNESESKAEDIAILFHLWEIFGIFNDEAAHLFEKFSTMDMTIGYDFENTNIIMRGVINNLSVSLVPENTRLVEKLNREMLKYIPNGDTQDFTLRTAKLLGKSAISVGTLYFGIQNGNQTMIKEAAKSALSLFNNLSNGERIGNSLEAIGMSPKMISECLEESRNTIKSHDVPIINVKEN